MLTLGSCWFPSWISFGVTFFSSSIRRVRSILYDFNCPYFPPEVMVELTRGLRRHFTTLTGTSTHITAFNPRHTTHHNLFNQVNTGIYKRCIIGLRLLRISSKALKFRQWVTFPFSKRSTSMRYFIASRNHCISKCSVIRYMGCVSGARIEPPLHRSLFLELYVVLYATI